MSDLLETVLVPFRRYRTPAGEPTCAREIDTGEVCTFYTRSGVCKQEERCALELDSDGRSRLLTRGTNEDGIAGAGFLEPLPECRLWSDQDGQDAPELPSKRR